MKFEQSSMRNLNVAYPEQQRDVPNVRNIMKIDDIWYLTNKTKVRITVAMM
jgi:maltodextrin utilization protein YvdJ